MKGKLYGVGIGPGDPELLTLKAIRLIRECDVIAVPGTEPKKTVAYQIAVQAVPELEKKELLALNMPMTKDPEQLQQSHSAAADAIENHLKAGKKTAFLTLGDPTVYSTYLYLHKQIAERGYDTEIVSGITSFCAVAARLNIGLAEQAQMLHIVPASYQIEEALKLPGTKVLMKAGRKMTQVKAKLLEQNASAVMVENCGMPEEKQYNSAQEIPDQAGYYSLIIVKEN